MASYEGENHYLVAVDCVIFGFDGAHLKLLLIKRGFEPEKGKWSLMGGFVRETESSDQAAERILKQLTGLEGVYLEQLKAFGRPNRDPVERTFSIVYFALIDIHQYEEKITDHFQPEWFPINDYPPLIFDHKVMVEMSKNKLRYKATMHPILFELLPEKFTMPQLQDMFEDIFNTEFDKRNFSRKILSLKLLVRLKEKDKSSSKRGAFYYRINKKKYRDNFHAFLNLIPNPGPFV